MFAAYEKYLRKRVNNLWLFENLRHLPLLLLFQLLFAVLWLVTALINDESSPALEEFSLHAILFQAELLIIPVCAINVIYFVQKKITQKRVKPAKTIMFKLLAAIVGVILGTAITEGIYAAYGIVDDDIISLGKYTIDPITTNFISYALLSLFISIPLFIKQAKRYELMLELKEKELHIQQTEQLLAQAELETLQAKINPHFLYNALNSIAGLIHDEPDKAEKMVLSLSDLFRYSLNSQGKAYTTIDEEITMVKTYLDIEKTRFEEQLQFSITIEEGCGSYLIPRFLVQPLVENAIKHGTSKVARGVLEIAVTKHQESLHIMVADNGPQFPEQLTTGYGMRNVSEKLDLLFPKNSSVSFYNDPKKYILIEIHQLKTQGHEV
ncbi:MAG: sensor histidine kinase [Bacteroidota bacterium]